MNKPSKRYYYKVNCDLWADDLGGEDCTVLLTRPEYRALKKHSDDIRFHPHLNDPGKFLYHKGIKFGINDWSRSLVTERYYRKFESIFNDSDDTYSRTVLDEIKDHVTQEESEKGYEDAPYYQLDLKIKLGPNGSIVTVALSNTEYLALKKHWSSISDVEILKEYVISKVDCEILSQAFHDSNRAKDFLEKIEKFVESEEKEELEAYCKENPESEGEDEDKDEDGNEDKQDEDEEEEENEDEDEHGEEGEGEGEEDEDEDEDDEKSLEKKVKRS